MVLRKIIYFPKIRTSRYISSLKKILNKTETTKANMNYENSNVDGSELLDGVDGWNENTASASEAIIKAERYGGNRTIKELQTATSKHFTVIHERNTKEKQKKDDTNAEKI